MSICYRSVSARLSCKLIASVPGLANQQRTSAVLGGFVVARIKAYRPVIWVSFALCIVGFGLLATLDEKSSYVKTELYQIVVAIGTGSLFQVPLIGLQASMPMKEMQTATATLGLSRQLGSTIGISIGGTIYASILRRMLSTIPGYSIPNSSSSENVAGLTQIQPPELRDRVLHAYTRSISTIWIVVAPVCFVALVFQLFIKEYTLVRKVRFFAVLAELH